MNQKDEKLQDTDKEVTPKATKERVPLLTKEALIARCQLIVEQASFDADIINALITIVLNVANQSNHLYCRDMADWLAEHLYAATVDCDRNRHSYIERLLHKAAKGGAK